MKKQKPNSLLRRLAVLALALSMVLSMAVSAYATTGVNQAITEDRNGVLCIEFGYSKNGKFYPWFVGSAFMISKTTLLTCYHCVHNTGTSYQKSNGSIGYLTPDEYAEYLLDADGLAWDAKWEQHTAIKVMLTNGTSVDAVERTGNAEVDFSVLTLQDTVGKHQVLTLRSTPVETSEPVTALGFPYTVTKLTEGTASKFTAKDVTTTSGTISKAQTMMDGINYIQHNAYVRGGNSGGPLVDVNGHVVGINSAVDSDSGMYSYAVAIDQVILTLDALEIDYQVAEDIGTVEPEPEPEPETQAPAPEPVTEAAPVVNRSVLESAISRANNISVDNYKQDQSWTAFQTALNAARSLSADASQSDVDAAAEALSSAMGALTEKSGPSPALIGGIAAAVVVLIVVIVLLVLKSGKKQKAAPAAAYAPPAQPQPDPAFVGGGFSPAPRNDVNSYGGGGYGDTDVLSGNAGETSILTADGADTTLLSKPYAVLVRKNGGEQITVGEPSFVLGRERSRVNYCVSNNSAVGRTHAKLVNENGKVCVVDMGSRNGTFVNGVKCSANVAVEVKSGDKITLADEEFEVKLL